MVAKRKVMLIFGTRPEAVKMAPIVLELRKHSDFFDIQVCVTAQHREMLDQVLGLFGIEPDIDLDLMQPGQTLSGLTARVLQQVSQVLETEKPDVVLVQGDTTTVMAAALAAFYQRIPVAHVEAGLRSYDPYSPFPEEINRRVAGVLSSYHFAPTETAQNALRREGVSDAQISMTGNPVIDALHIIAEREQPPAAKALLAQARADTGERKLILVTAHRRENFGAPFEQICAGLRQLAERNEDITILYPVHLNPRVREPVQRNLHGVNGIVLTDPVDYDVMVHLMKAAYIVLTDSGGVQEEAPALGKPVLVMRTETERPEAVNAGTARLVGTDAACIVSNTEELLHDSAAYERMAQAISPYGDGRSAQRIVDVLRH